MEEALEEKLTETIEQAEISDTDKEFQNLLAIRSQLVTLLIATAGGTVWLINLDSHAAKHIALIAIGVFFIVNLIKNIRIANFKIQKLIIKRK